MKNGYQRFFLIFGLCLLTVGFLSCAADDKEEEYGDSSSNSEFSLSGSDGESDDDAQNEDDNSQNTNDDIDGDQVPPDDSPDDDEDDDDIDDDDTEETDYVSSWTYNVVSASGYGNLVYVENQGLDNPEFIEGEYNRVQVFDFYPPTWKFYIWFDFTLENQVAFKFFELYDEENSTDYFSLLAIKPVLFLTRGEIGEEIANTSWGLFRWEALAPIPYNVEIVSKVVSHDETVEVPFGVIEGCTHLEVVLTELVDLGFVDGPVQYWSHPMYGIVKAVDIPYYYSIELVDVVLAAP